MSDDVFGAFGGDDIFDDAEQKQPQGEAQNNKTFIIAVAALGGLLVLAIGAFMLWALVLNRPSELAEAPAEVATETAMVEAIVETDTPEPTSAPTDTPKPTPTPLLGPTKTPTPEGLVLADEDATTPIVRRTPTPTSTSMTLAKAEDTRAETGVGSGETPASTELAKTGLGEWVLVGVAVVLIATVVLARRLRSA